MIQAERVIMCLFRVADTLTFGSWLLSPRNEFPRQKLTVVRKARGGTNAIIPHN